jgi:H+/gluconate symporter-like permease
MSVVQSLQGAHQIVPPHPESTGIVPGTKVAIQNDPIYAIVAARQQILVPFTQAVCHNRNIQKSPLRAQILASGFLDS